MFDRVPVTEEGNRRRNGGWAGAGGGGVTKISYVTSNCSSHRSHALNGVVTASHVSLLALEVQK